VSMFEPVQAFDHYLASVKISRGYLKRFKSNRVKHTHKRTLMKTSGQSNLTKSASRWAHSAVRGHPRGSKVVPLNSWGRVSY